MIIDRTWENVWPEENFFKPCPIMEEMFSARLKYYNLRKFQELRTEKKVQSKTVLRMQVIGRHNYAHFYLKKLSC